jgi:hypothetical protein
MARVTVAYERFEAGRFPPICVRTGAPGEVELVIEARYTPPWVVWMLLFGILPFFIAAHFSAQRHVGAVPVSLAYGKKLRTAQLSQRIAFGVAVGLFILSFGADMVAAAWAGLAALVVAGLIVVYWWFLDVRLRSDEHVLTIKNAHPRFVDAMRADGSV